MERKGIMESFSVSSCSSTTSTTSTIVFSRAAHGVHTLSTELEREHELEKLEFALALAIAEGRSEAADGLRSRIESFGGCGEEPGT